MNEDKKRKNKIIGISIGILVVLLVVISSTYAYWQITRSQKDPNSIVAACLDITMEDQFGTLTPSQNMPISDVEGLQDSGFTFTVKNHCEQDVAYIIGIDSVEVDTTGTNGYMLDGSIKVSIDNTTPRIFGSLEDIDHVEANDTYVIRNSKKINTAVVPGKKNGVEGTDTHTIKTWIDADAPVSENNKVFGGRVFITGGQFITDDNPITQVTDESCFEMNGTELIGYDESCGTDVTIPMYVGENAVKTIDSNAFKGTKVTEAYYKEINPVEKMEEADVSMENVLYSFIVNDFEMGVDENYDMANIEYAVMYPTDEATRQYLLEQLAGIEQQLQKDIPVIDAAMGEDEPKLSANQLKVYMNSSGSETHYIYGQPTYLVLIKSLNLSQAFNLEKIEDRAFTNVTANRNEIGSDTDFIDAIANSSISLTSLTFGNNMNSIAIGNLAFSRIDVDELTTYSSYKASTNDKYTYFDSAFIGSDIDNLIIKATGNDRIINMDELEYEETEDNAQKYIALLYLGTYYKNLNIAEGITEIEDYVFSGMYNSNIHIGETLTLPNSLKIIGTRTFYNIPFNTVNLGTGLTSIGEKAFHGMTANQVINVPMTQIEFEAQTTRGADWSSNATIKYQS